MYWNDQYWQILSHLFCTLISENQGLEKLRSILNLRKISGPAELNFFSVHLNFFSVCHLNFFQIYTINLKKSRWQTEKKLRCTEKKFRCAGPEIFLRFETDLNFSRPWFSEIKVQIKRPMVLSLPQHNGLTSILKEYWYFHPHDTHKTIYWGTLY